MSAYKGEILEGPFQIKLQRPGNEINAQRRQKRGEIPRRHRKNTMWGKEQSE